VLKVFIVLVGSLIAAPIVGSDFFQIYLYEIDYLLYCAARGLVYVLLALFGLIMAKQEQAKDNNFSAFLILALCFCMAVTGLFNLVMINHDVYNLLNPFKSGDGFSWRNIYLSVEVLVSFIVGGHGISYVTHMDNCHDSVSNDIIRDNIINNQGK